jgi:DNA-nicking Smr family endonuclease
MLVVLCGLKYLRGQELGLNVNKHRRKDDPLDDPAQEFLDAVRDVEPLPDPGRVVHATRPPTPVPLQRRKDDLEVLRDSLSDRVEPDLELESGDELTFLRPGLSRQVLRRLRSGYWATQAELDLHGSRIDEARALLADFLALAVKRGQRCVIVVHGKGLSSKNREPVLKRKVASWLIQRGEVLAFTQARPADGGGGAVVVLLKGLPARRTASAEEDIEGE